MLRLIENSYEWRQIDIKIRQELQSEPSPLGGRGQGRQMPPNNFDNALFDFYKLGKIEKTILYSL